MVGSSLKVKMLPSEMPKTENLNAGFRGFELILVNKIINSSKLFGLLSDDLPFVSFEVRENFSCKHE